MHQTRIPWHRGATDTAPGEWTRLDTGVAPKARGLGHRNFQIHEVILDTGISRSTRCFWTREFPDPRCRGHGVSGTLRPQRWCKLKQSSWWCLTAWYRVFRTRRSLKLGFDIGNCNGFALQFMPEISSLDLPKNLKLFFRAA